MGIFLNVNYVKSNVSVQIPSIQKRFVNVLLNINFIWFHVNFISFLFQGGAGISSDGVQDWD